ncbi:hypothetical protein HDV00_006441 [Rhizophlyctis rosea]|nr:hypothetical protein HDV00_006441 [Rhizophlyctis rosea]
MPTKPTNPFRVLPDELITRIFIDDVGEYLILNLLAGTYINLRRVNKFFNAALSPLHRQMATAKAAHIMRMEWTRRNPSVSGIMPDEIEHQLNIVIGLPEDAHIFKNPMLPVSFMLLIIKLWSRTFYDNYEFFDHFQIIDQRLSRTSTPHRHKAARMDISGADAVSSEYWSTLPMEKNYNIICQLDNVDTLVMLKNAEAVKFGECDWKYSSAWGWSTDTPRWAGCKFEWVLRFVAEGSLRWGYLFDPEGPKEILDGHPAFYMHF